MYSAQVHLDFCRLPRTGDSCRTKVDYSLEVKGSALLASHDFRFERGTLKASPTDSYGLQVVKNVWFYSGAWYWHGHQILGAVSLLQGWYALVLYSLETETGLLLASNNHNPHFAVLNSAAKA